MKAELVPIDGGTPIPITRDVSVVGRREYCDIRVDHPSLSKRHAVLVKTDGLLILRDLASTNGTKVKGQRIRWAALLPDDRISFGSIKFRVYLGPEHLPAPSEQVRGQAKAGPARQAPPEFATPTPVATPVVGVPAPEGRSDDSEDWRRALTAAAGPAPARPAVLNDHDLLIEDDDEFIELDDDAIIDLK